MIEFLIRKQQYSEIEVCFFFVLSYLKYFKECKTTEQIYNIHRFENGNGHVINKKKYIFIGNKQK